MDDHEFTPDLWWEGKAQLGHSHSHVHGSGDPVRWGHRHPPQDHGHIHVRYDPATYLDYSDFDHHDPAADRDDPVRAANSDRDDPAAGGAQ